MGNIEENQNEAYDKEAEYGARVAPLLFQLDKECERIGLHYLVHVVVRECDQGIRARTFLNVCGRSGYGAARCKLIGNLAAASGVIELSGTRPE